ncbi:phosphopantothenoylcysteine decarboxylase [Planctomyces sp. SH-PL62]|uniref:phosphopantothenoylcysteine decarboxylase domain-containing protein n=1 Tax=Planctomyces sp. SH-PL62 TaxID=1636152 RepID=UPI00078D34FC|nr:phosphopantothenoylcysteine decarboxylase [Planctomyces sp. SH-PL62]AMV38025.1 phosphopantothenate--cysteine ligase [Planctomyces sp. SH-PL62]
MKVVVTGGGTSAPIDDVRVITNVSTGRTAAAITEACLDRGDEVWHLHAPLAELPLLRSARCDLDADPDAERERLDRLRDRWRDRRDRLHLRPLAAGTVDEYAAALRAVLTTEAIDVAFLPMAVSDYEPVPRLGKISSQFDDLAIPLRRTSKVIRSVRDWAPSVFLVGFKLLSGEPLPELIRRAQDACLINRADVTVANDLEQVRAGRHTLHLVRPGRPVETLEPGPDLAARLVDRIREWAGAGV